MNSVNTRTPRKITLDFTESIDTEHKFEYNMEKQAKEPLDKGQSVR